MWWPCSILEDPVVRKNIVMTGEYESELFTLGKPVRRANE